VLKNGLTISLKINKLKPKIMKNPETIKITLTETVTTSYEVEIPSYRMSWCNGKPFTLYKMSGTSEKQRVEAVNFYESAPTYYSNCVSNAFQEGNTVATEMEWLDAIQSVISHLTNEVELACKVLTPKN
jgi:hypothetical protein